MFNLGPFEILAIAAVVLLIFGPKRLPELAKSMGKGIKDFKKALESDDTKDVSPKKESLDAAKNQEETQTTIPEKDEHKS